jgi:hypothetical protein
MHKRLPNLMRRSIRYLPALIQTVPAFRRLASLHLGSSISCGRRFGADLAGRQRCRTRALVDRLWSSNDPTDIVRLEAQARLIAAYEERKWPNGRRASRT